MCKVVRLCLICYVKGYVNGLLYVNAINDVMDHHFLYRRVTCVFGQHIIVSNYEGTALNPQFIRHRRGEPIYADLAIPTPKISK